MKILIYGAGNIGSLYAALLQESGQEVSILARGRRLADIREHGILLFNVVTRKRTVAHVNTVERLHIDDAYDLVLVALPSNHVLEVLPILARSQKTPSVLFFGNHVQGPEKMVEALGRDRVLLGFPGAAGVAREGCIHYLITSVQEQPTTVGELDGTRSPRIEAIIGVLRASGFSAAHCSNMDAWLKTHAAEVSPTANAFYMVGADPGRFARTRDALVLMLRAIREGYRVLQAHDIPVTPASHRIVQWLPEPLLLLIMRRMVEGESTKVKLGHAIGARSEWKTIADQLRVLAAATSVPNPATDRLHTYLDASVEPIPDGSAEIPLSWSGVWAVGAALAGMVVVISMVWRGTL